MSIGRGFLLFFIERVKLLSFTACNCLDKIEWIYIVDIMERDTVNVHTDYRVYAIELINFISVIITTRVKNDIVKKASIRSYRTSKCSSISQHTRKQEWSKVESGHLLLCSSTLRN